MPNAGPRAKRAYRKPRIERRERLADVAEQQTVLTGPIKG